MDVWCEERMGSNLLGHSNQPQTHNAYSWMPIGMGVAGMLLSWLYMYRWLQRTNLGPKTWPLLGAAIEQMLNYHRMHDWLVGYLSKSKTLSVPMPFTHYTYTADPANVEYILKTNFANYPKGEAYRHYMQVLLGDGIFNADGEMWRKQRKTASFEFASKNLRDFSTAVFREYALKLSHILSRTSLYQQSLDMQDLLMRMTLDSICKVGFGVEIGTLSVQLPDNPFARAFDVANTVVTFRFIDPLWRIKRFLHIGSETSLKQSIQAVDDFTYTVIRKRKAEIQQARASGTQARVKADILSRFIELSEDPQSNLTDKNLRDIVLNFVIAGRDTTAATLSWFVYMLITHPQVAENIYDELRGFEEERAREEDITLLSMNDPDDTHTFNQRLAQFAHLLNYDSLGRLPYLYAAITETLRLYPAVPQVHKTCMANHRYFHSLQDPKGILEDDTLPDGTKLKRGGMITYVPYSMGRMEYIWGHDASEFKPERWFKDGALQHVSPFKFTAFQAGPRICLGRDSAYLQMKMTTAILCRFFKFQVVPGHLVKYRMMTILSMAHGLKLSIYRRH